MFYRSLVAASRKNASHRDRRTVARGSCLESLELRVLLTPGVLVLPDTPSPPTFGATVDVSEFGNTLDTTSDFNTSGGNFLGTFNGSPLIATYCLTSRSASTPQTRLTAHRDHRRHDLRHAGTECRRDELAHPEHRAHRHLP